MKAHVIEDGIVINTIAVTSLDFMSGLVDAELGGKRGDLWDGTNFITPPEPTIIPEISKIDAVIGILEAKNVLGKEDIDSLNGKR